MTVAKKKDNETWAQYLQSLKKHSVPKPEKRVFDIKRQKIARKEKTTRLEIKRKEKEIDKLKAEHEDLKKEFNIVKSNVIFDSYNKQRETAMKSAQQLHVHNNKTKEMRMKKKQLQKHLGQFKSMQELEGEIRQEELNISRGVYPNINDEKKAIRRISKLKKLRSTVVEYQDTETAIEAHRQDEKYKQDLNFKKDQFDELDKLNEEKKKFEEARANARNKMNDVWDKLQKLYDNKKELLDKAKDLNKDAAKVGDEYRAKEKEYTDYIQKVQNAEQKTEVERNNQRRKKRESDEADREKKALSSQSSVTQATQRAEAQRKQREEEEAKRVADNRATQKAKAQQKKKETAQSGGGERKDKKKSKKEEEKDAPSTVVDMIIPFHEEIEQHKALKGYLQSLMPRPPKPDADPPKGKRKKRKFKGPCKHNLNWVNAFAEADCANLLPRKRQEVEKCLGEIAAKLDELETKSKEKLKELHEAKAAAVNGQAKAAEVTDDGHSPKQDDEAAGGSKDDAPAEASDAVQEAT